MSTSKHLSKHPVNRTSQPNFEWDLGGIWFSPPPPTPKGSIIAGNGAQISTDNAMYFPL